MSGARPMPLDPLAIDRLARMALEEDLGRAGDITTQATIPAGTKARARIVAREAGVIAGLDIARAAFRLIDPNVSVTAAVEDGAAVSPGALVATVAGEARSLLSAERVALNYLGRLSGIASLTRRYVEAIAGTRARVCCTRKTTPGLRAAEKYAVRCGGGANHRFGLDDAVLIKDNHVAACAGVVAALRAAKAGVGHLVKIEIEVDTLDQLDAVLGEGADVVLLDNMPVPMLTEAVARVAGRMRTEASGGVTLETIAAIARTGVDLISVGALTHSVKVMDLGLDFEVA